MKVTYRTECPSKFWLKCLLADSGIEVENLMNAINEALNAIDEFISYRLKSRLLKNYEGYLHSVMVQSVSSHLTNEFKSSKRRLF